MWLVGSLLRVHIPIGNNSFGLKKGMYFISNIPFRKPKPSSYVKRLDNYAHEIWMSPYYFGKAEFVSIQEIKHSSLVFFQELWPYPDQKSFTDEYGQPLKKMDDSNGRSFYQYTDGSVKSTSNYDEHIVVINDDNHHSIMGIAKLPDDQPYTNYIDTTYRYELAIKCWLVSVILLIITVFVYRHRWKNIKRFMLGRKGKRNNKYKKLKAFMTTMAIITVVMWVLIIEWKISGQYCIDSTSTVIELNTDITGIHIGIVYTNLTSEQLKQQRQLHLIKENFKYRRDFCTIKKNNFDRWANRYRFIPLTMLSFEAKQFNPCGVKCFAGLDEYCLYKSMQHKAYLSFIPTWCFLLTFISSAAYAFWRDRPFKPGSCSWCGYDLTKNTSGVCPNCGNSVACNENQHELPIAVNRSQ